MKRLMSVSVSILTVAAISVSSVIAQEMMIYPAKGQSPQQEKTDKGACMEWASQQSGFNPTDALAPTAPPPAVTAPTARAGRGMVHGAVAGTAIGAIAGNTGEGAAIGAAAGLLFGHARRRGQAEQAQQQQQAYAGQQAENYAQKQTAFNRAYSACLTGRGYTVN